MNTDKANEKPQQPDPLLGLGFSDQLGPTPERKRVQPAFGYKFHADCARRLMLGDTAEFIEAQNAEIGYLYAALQGVRNRAKRAGSRNKVDESICSEANFALQYGS